MIYVADNEPKFSTLFFISDLYDKISFMQRIPQSFCDAAHFPPSKRKVVLRDSDGKAWDVICLYDKRGHCLSGGWGSFALYHNLKLGDVCKFELVSTDEMQVHVL